MALRRGQTGSTAIQTEVEANKGAVAAINATVAGMPAASAHTGKIRYVANGASGSPCLAYSNGTNWLRITLGAAIAAS